MRIEIDEKRGQKQSRAFHRAEVVRGCFGRRPLVGREGRDGSESAVLQRLAVAVDPDAKTARGPAPAARAAAACRRGERPRNNERYAGVLRKSCAAAAARVEQ
jgi:hypothetical protein